MPFYRSQKKVEEPQNLCQPKPEFEIPQRRLVGDRDSTVEGIEGTGNIDALQRYRLHEDAHNIKWDHPAGKDPMILHHLYFIDEDIREVVQEEECIKLHHLGTSRAERLEDLNKRYWFLERRWWDCYSCLRQSYQQPGFDLWRSNPKWYMHQMLIEDCASRNGCCARACGCCNHREPTPTRKLGVGHCTVECGCCIKARGCRFSEEDKNTLKREFRDLVLQCPKHRIIRVASWGLVGGSYENPFDLIQVEVGAPPRYGSSSEETI